MKKKVVQKIFIVICTILVLLIVGFSPNLIKKLTGNVISYEQSTNVAVDTGVELVSDLFFNSNTTNLNFELINNSGESINTGYGYAAYGSDTLGELGETCFGHYSNYGYVPISNCNNYKQITIRYRYALPYGSSNVYDIYTVSYNMDRLDEIKNEIQNLEDTPVEYNVTYKHNNSENLSIQISKSKVYMDITEDLYNQNINFSYKTNFGSSNNDKYKIEAYAPQSSNSSNSSIYGNENAAQPRLSNYFTYDTYDNIFTFNATNDYVTAESHRLWGKPSGQFTGVVDVYIPIYVVYHKDDSWIGTGGYDRNTYQSDNFSGIDQIKIQFNLYDKSKLLEAIKLTGNKLSDTTKDYNKESLKQLYEFLYLRAIPLFYTKDVYTYDNKEIEVTQNEIDEVTNLLNNYEISYDYADYTDYNNLIQNEKVINAALHPEWYSEDSENYEIFINLYNEKSNYENLTISHQAEVDDYVEKLQTAFNNLTMSDADYSAVDEAIEKANVIVNKTEDGKYDLYTQESWNRLKDAINAVDESLKIEDQIIVDGYATAILEAIETLEIAPANYDNLNKLIDDYENSDGYINNWYTIETANEVSNVINSIDYTKKITEQDIVDNWEIQLISTLANLKLKLALGYYDKDNYHPEGLPNSLSVEGYMNYFKSLNRNYYTDETLELIDELISAYDKGEAEEFKITIDNQSELDTYIEYLNNVKENMLIKKPGDYTQIEKYLEKINSLNRDYYVDFSQVDKAIENINYDYKIDEQDKIDEKAQEIKSALDGLVMKKADYTNFNAVYEKAKKLNENYYIDFSKVTEALEKAESSKNLYIDKQSVVDEITKELNDAIEKLVLKDADYSKIEDLKNNISHMDKTKYTNFNIVETALNSIVYGKKIDEQSSVDQMYLNLKKAYDSLEKIKADYKKLYEALANAKKYESNKTNYTNYDEVEKLINSIDYNLTWDRQDEVDELTKKINDAVSNLVKKLANYDELSEILSKIPKDYSGLDTNLQKEIKEFLQKAKSISNNLKYDEQYKIDELVEIGKKLLNKIPKNEISSEIVNESNEQTNTNQSSKKIVNYIIINKTKFEKLDETIKYIVEYDVSSVNISVGLASKDSKYVIYGGDVLTPGKNEVTIVVTTKEGKNYTYKLEITRKDTSNYLSDLKIENYDIEFSKTKQEYSLKIDKDVQKLDITVITEDENAKVSIKGNENLKDGSKITVEVKSTDNDIRIYTINIEKSSLSIVGIIIILVMFLSILAAIVKFINYKKNNAI